MPRLGEIRRLRPVDVPAAVVRRQWGSAQRFLLAGVALMFLAAVGATIFYSQYHPSEQRVDRFIHGSRQSILALKPWPAIVYYRQVIAPGIETPADTTFQSIRERLGIGLVVALVALAAGAVLTGVGALGLARAGSTAGDCK